MPLARQDILPLLEFVRIDKFYVSCHFKCDIKNKTVISTVPFEPYEGKIEIPLKEMILHPIKSYNRYYHTPITIYGNNCNETIVLKAFENVSKHFRWSSKDKKYIYY
jgi:hypothetical protein